MFITVYHLQAPVVRLPWLSNLTFMLTLALLKGVIFYVNGRFAKRTCCMQFNHLIPDYKILWVNIHQYWDCRLGNDPPGENGLERSLRWLWFCRAWGWGLPIQCSWHSKSCVWNNSTSSEKIASCIITECFQQLSLPLFGHYCRAQHHSIRSTVFQQTNNYGTNFRRKRKISDHPTN
jgi:hypothetical protein